MTARGENGPVLRCRGVKKAFRQGRGETLQALDGVSLEIGRGKLAVLVGPDGAGKTTLIRLIAGLMAADEGELTVLGANVATDPQQVQNRLAYMPQRFGLYEDLSVQENLDLYADLHGVTPLNARSGIPPSGNDRAGSFLRPTGRPTLRRHETETGAGVHVDPRARVPAAGRAHGGRGPAFAQGTVADYPRSGPSKGSRCS